MSKAGLGFTDIAGKQEIRPAKNKTMDVILTPFVQMKIHSGELIVVSSGKSSAADETQPQTQTGAENPENVKQNSQDGDNQSQNPANATDQQQQPSGAKKVLNSILGKEGGK